MMKCRGLVRSMSRFSQPRSLGLGSHVSDNDPKILQQEKERALHPQPDQKPIPGSVPHVEEWNPLLASESEAVVKAERTPEMEIEEMTEYSINIIQDDADTLPHRQVSNADTNRTSAYDDDDQLAHKQTKRPPTHQNPENDSSMGQSN
jgi:hypothetical protein